MAVGNDQPIDGTG